MDIFGEKRENSIKKLKELKTALIKGIDLGLMPDLCVFVTGSYARLEASKHSDIDLFFIYNGSMNSILEPNINSMRLFSNVINITDQLEFPKFSNDGEYLKILELPNILAHLGSPEDDRMNHFTARLLMILESKPVLGEITYQTVMSKVLETYFKDYPDHPRNFKPTFLVNDILRFWKTLCLNYENKRNQPDSDRTRRIAQKIKNLKLKFSRMLTCYGSICYIASRTGVIDQVSIRDMALLSPLERLRESVADFDFLASKLKEAEDEYRWFLELTNVSEAELKSKFEDLILRKEAFERADRFGQSMYCITTEIARQNGYLRYLVV